MKKIWSNVKVGNMELPNRLAMAPMTRSRAYADGTPGELAALYYSQRASMGLIISEGVQPSDDGQGYMLTPGIYRQEHIDGWRKVTDAVHEKGGHIFIQLMHAGRMSHPDNTPHHRQPVAPSQVAPKVQMFTANGMKDIPEPRKMTIEDIKNTIGDYRKAARAAIDAGADGVELHGANGYLIHQFIGDNTNKRTDEYGGSIENRARFAIEVATQVAEEIGPERVGIRISPGDLAYIDIFDGPEGLDVYRYLIKELSKLNLAYIHVLHAGNDEFLKEIRSLWPNILIVNRMGRPLELFDADIEADLADIVSVGSWSLANPDLVERLRAGAMLNEPDQMTFYGGDNKGYTDYPFMNEKII